MIRDAIQRNLQVLAESTQRLSESLKAEAPDFPWRQIAGLRNILVHEYLGIDQDVIWQIVESDLSGLKETVERLSKEVEARGRLGGESG